MLSTPYGLPMLYGDMPESQHSQPFSSRVVSPFQLVVVQRDFPFSWQSFGAPATALLLSFFALHCSAVAPPVNRTVSLRVGFRWLAVVIKVL